MEKAEWLAAIGRLPDNSKRVALVFAAALVEADWPTRRLMLAAACMLTEAQVDAAMNHMRNVGIVVPVETN